MRRLFIFVCSLTVSLFSVMAQTDASLSKGIKLAEEQQYASAAQVLNQLPESVDREYQLGKIALYEGQKEVSEQHFSKVNQLDPKNILATIGLASIEIQKKNSAEAEKLVSKAKKQAKKNAELLAEIALICAVGPEKDFNLAIQAIERGKEVSTKSAPLYLALGDVELARNEYGNALNAYEWASMYNNSNALIFRKIGTIQTLARDYRNGIVSLNKSIELDPNQIIVYKNLSDLQFTFGKYAESLSNYENYLSKITPTTDDKERLALILFFNKKYDESAKEMDLVLAENPNTPVLYRIRGYSAYETGDYAKGVEAMQRFFELQNPNKIIPSDYSYYGKLNAKVKNDTIAIEYLKKAIKADSTQNDLLDELATVYSRNHNHLGAVSCYNQMIANGFPRGNALLAIGKEYFFLGSYLKAKADSVNKSSNPTPLTPEIASAFKDADSTFTVLTQASPTYAGGFLWKGRSQSFLDPESTSGLAKPAYEQAAALMEKDPVKNKKALIESYQYLASFNYLSYDKNFKSNPDSAKVSRDTAVGFFEKILQLEPNDAKTKGILQQLKK